MSDDIKNKLNDEIDLLELFKTLWAGKILISFTIFAAIVCASLYRAKQKFTVHIHLLLLRVGNLAKFRRFKWATSLQVFRLHQARAVISLYLSSFTVRRNRRKLLKDKNLVKEIFKGEWDTEQQTFRQPPDSSLSPYVRKLKQLLTGKKTQFI